MRIDKKLQRIVKRFQQSTAAYNIGPGDVFRVSVYSYGDFIIEPRVSADGRITFPLIGEVAASGKSNLELEEAIALHLIDGGFIQDTQISATVLKHVSKRVSVMGNINKPEGYPLDSESSKADLIAIAVTGHIWLVALILLLAFASRFFLLYSFFALSSMSHQAIIAVTIGYNALAGSRSSTSYAFKNSEI